LCRQFALHCLVLSLPVSSLLLECDLPCPYNVLVPVLVATSESMLNYLVS
jgi:hypothetical protein